MSDLTRPLPIKSVQMRDVAERAGVSITTVSHIVNNTRFVAPETRERVLAAMRDLNFYRNALARRLVRGRGDALGLIISDIENPFYPELIKSFETAALEQGFDMLLCATNYDADRARTAVRRMIENKVPGVAIITSQLDATLIDELGACGVATVVMDGKSASSSSRVNIRIDYDRGAREAMAHLASLGHKKCAVVTGPMARTSAIKYRDAILRAAATAGISEPEVVEGTADLDGGARTIRSLMSGNHAPTAVVFGNDVAALGAIEALAQMNISVPNDVSVIGSDDIAFCRLSRPALTTVRLSRERIGRVACEALDSMIRSKPVMAREITVETELVVRQSTGAAKGKVQESKKWEAKAR